MIDFSEKYLKVELTKLQIIVKVGVKTLVILYLPTLIIIYIILSFIVLDKVFMKWD